MYFNSMVPAPAPTPTTTTKQRKDKQQPKIISFMNIISVTRTSATTLQTQPETTNETPNPDLGDNTTHNKENSVQSVQQPEPTQDHEPGCTEKRNTQDLPLNENPHCTITTKDHDPGTTTSVSEPPCPPCPPDTTHSKGPDKRSSKPAQKTKVTVSFASTDIREKKKEKNKTAQRAGAKPTPDPDKDSRQVMSPGPRSGTTTPAPASEPDPRGPIGRLPGTKRLQESSIRTQRRSISTWLKVTDNKHESKSSDNTREGEVSSPGETQQQKKKNDPKKLKVDKTKEVEEKE